MCGPGGVGGSLCIVRGSLFLGCGEGGVWWLFCSGFLLIVCSGAAWVFRCVYSVFGGEKQDWRGNFH